MLSSNSKAADKIPLKLKLRAWWEGFDQSELAAAYLEHYGESAEAEEAAAAKPVVEVKTAAGDLPFDPWDKDRIDVAQYIWGKGYCGPGGAEYVVSISKLLNMTSEMSMMQLGAGLGGPARTLAEKFGVWVTGYEESATLIEAGNELSKLAGLTGKAELHQYDPENVKDFDRKFDRAFAKEALFTIQNKQNLVTHSYECMKPEGLFLMTDYVLASESVVVSPDYKEWKKAEVKAPCPVTQDELLEILRSAGYSVRVNEDISDRQFELIAKAWDGADTIVSKLMDNNSSALVDTLLKEAEVWALRSRLLKSGSLKLIRVLGYKKENKSRMMSNW